MQVDAVIARLKDRAPSLRTVQGGAELTALMQNNALPQQAQASAFVIPLGLRGGQVSAASTLFVQAVEETISVLLTLRNTGQTGSKGLADIQTPIAETIAAIAGWGPVDAPGVFALVRGGVVSLAAGTFVYSIDFAIGDQLRIIP